MGVCMIMYNMNFKTHTLFSGRSQNSFWAIFALICHLSLLRRRYLHSNDVNKSSAKSCFQSAGMPREDWHVDGFIRRQFPQFPFTQKPEHDLSIAFFCFFFPILSLSDAPISLYLWNHKLLILFLLPVLFVSLSQAITRSYKAYCLKFTGIENAHCTVSCVPAKHTEHNGKRSVLKMHCFLFTTFKVSTTVVETSGFLLLGLAGSLIKDSGWKHLLRES